MFLVCLFFPSGIVPSGIKGLVDPFLSDDHTQGGGINEPPFGRETGQKTLFREVFY